MPRMAYAAVPAGRSAGSVTRPPGRARGWVLTSCLWALTLLLRACAHEIAQPGLGLVLRGVLLPGERDTPGVFAGPVARPVHEGLVAGVDEPVREGLGDDGVGEQRVPVGGGSVGGEDQRAAGPFGDQLVEVVGLGGGELEELFVPGPAGVPAGHVRERPAGLEEPDFGAVADGQVPQGLGDVAFAHADGAVEDHGLAGVQPAQGGQVADGGGGQFGGGGEVEAFQGGLLFEPSAADALGQRHAVAAGDLVLTQHLEELQVAQFPGAGVGEAGIEGGQHPWQFQCPQRRGEPVAVGDRGGGGHGVPPIAVKTRTACPASCPSANTQPRVWLPGLVSAAAWPPVAAASHATAAVRAAGGARYSGTWMRMSWPMVSDRPVMPARSIRVAAARSACAWAASGRAGISPAPAAVLVAVVVMTSPARWGPAGRW